MRLLNNVINNYDPSLLHLFNKEMKKDRMWDKIVGVWKVSLKCKCWNLDVWPWQGHVTGDSMEAFPRQTADIITQEHSWPKIFLPLGLWDTLLSKIFFPPFPLPSSGQNPSHSSSLALDSPCSEGCPEYPMSLTPADEVGFPALNLHFTLSFFICITSHEIYYCLYFPNKDKDLAVMPTFYTQLQA